MSHYKEVYSHIRHVQVILCRLSRAFEITGNKRLAEELLSLDTELQMAVLKLNEYIDSAATEDLRKVKEGIPWLFP